ncbi:hypothetical protein BVY03_00735 [bacterium K02(2017)]|nr:hypothetical protein BVY03_00735 [bacterium K02(2017)]
MVKKARTYDISNEISDLLNTIESTNDENERIQSIKKLASEKSADAARVLISVYHFTMWRSIKIELIRALGKIPHQRSLEFLILLAEDTSDLPLAKEAILALGHIDRPLAGEYLLSLISIAKHPLKKEVVIALADMFYFPCSKELAELIQDKEFENNASILEHLIIALGRQGHSQYWKIIETFISEKIAQEQPNLFNSAILAAGMIGGRKAIEKLESIDTSYLFFSHQLKIASIKSIHLRLAKTIEDAISDLLNSKNSNEQIKALRLLREFPKESAWEAYVLLAQEIDLNTECLVRIALSFPDRANHDLEFIIKNHQKIDNYNLAALCRCHNRFNKRFIIDLFEKLPSQTSLDLSFLVKDEFIAEYLYHHLLQTNTSETSVIFTCNAMTQQVYMAAFSNQLTQKISEFFLNALHKAKDQKIKGRIIRALGQIKDRQKTVINILSQLIKKEDSLKSSLYNTCILLDTLESTEILNKRLKTIIQDNNNAEEINLIIENLAKATTLPSLDCLSRIPEDLIKTNLKSLLNILSRQSIAGLEKIVELGLKEKEFQTQILAISAARLNHNEKIRKSLFDFLNNKNHCLEGRALDSLCRGATINEHLQLMNLIDTKDSNRDYKIKFFQSLIPQKNTSYLKLIELIDQFLHGKNFDKEDLQIQSSCLRLRDNLSMNQDNLDCSYQTQKETKKLDETIKHNLDEDLALNIKTYNQFSETVKSVLRNGELTLKHPQLFDERVDKSTAVVEYVKSIDILLQERLGTKLFLKKSSDLLTDLQNRICFLGLDDFKRNSHHLAEELQCSNHMTPAQFPTPKITGLAQSIFTGKILYQQYRAIDGLRAWSVLFILFGRDFNYNDKNLKSIFNFKSAQNAHICKIAAQMNDLQEARNQAAHRGTMLETAELEEIRKLSFDLLEKLGDLL